MNHTNRRWSIALLILAVTGLQADQGTIHELPVSEATDEQVALVKGAAETDLLNAPAPVAQAVATPVFGSMDTERIDLQRQEILRQMRRSRHVRLAVGAGCGAAAVGALYWMFFAGKDDMTKVDALEARIAAVQREREEEVASRNTTQTPLTNEMAEKVIKAVGPVSAMIEKNEANKAVADQQESSNFIMRHASWIGRWISYNTTPILNAVAVNALAAAVPTHILINRLIDKHFHPGTMTWFINKQLNIAELFNQLESRAACLTGDFDFVQARRRSFDTLVDRRAGLVRQGMFIGGTSDEELAGFDHTYGMASYLRGVVGDSAESSVQYLDSFIATWNHLVHELERLAAFAQYSIDERRELSPVQQVRMAKTIDDIKRMVQEYAQRLHTLMISMDGTAKIAKELTRLVHEFRGLVKLELDNLELLDNR